MGRQARIRRNLSIGPREPTAAGKEAGFRYPTEAYPLGVGPSRANEGWEAITISTYVICLATVALALSGGANTKESFTSWARTEAEKRQEILADGGEIEFGKYYSTASYEKDEEKGKIPILKEEE